MVVAEEDKEEEATAEGVLVAEEQDLMLDPVSQAPATTVATTS